MSLKNIVPEIWAAGILKERDKAAVGVNHCNRDYEGEIKKRGDQVKILTIGDVESYPYEANKDMRDPDLLKDEAQWLVIDMAQYCNVAIDDLDAVQANVKLMTEAQRKIGLRMADDVDKDIFSLHTKISAAQTINGTGGVTAANVFGFLAEIRQRFSEANVPNSETIYLEVSPAIYTKFVLARIAQDTDNSKIINKGDVDKRLYGIEISQSNNICKVGDNYKCLARTKAAVSFASQITEIEPYRMEKRFSDALKSLQVWGKKIVRPKELFLFDAKVGSES